MERNNETRYHMHSETDNVKDAVKAIADAHIPFEEGCDYCLTVKADTKEELQAVIAAWAAKLGVAAPVPEEDELLDYPDRSKDIFSLRHGAFLIDLNACNLIKHSEDGTFEQVVDDIISVIWRCNDLINWLGATDEELYEAYKRVCTDE